MRLLDLCAGIGGFSLAASWLGVEVAGQVEIDPWCRRVLAKHWPNTIRMADVFDVKGNEFGTIDIITAGFPCQPYSVAGKRRGSEDDRAIWPQIARITCAVRPTYCLFENVPGIIGFSEMGLDGVLADLESIGYTAGAVVIPAGAVNALHRRDRVWIMGYADGEQQPQLQGVQSDQWRRTSNTGESMADTEGISEHRPGTSGRQCQHGARDCCEGVGNDALGEAARAVDACIDELPTGLVRHGGGIDATTEDARPGEVMQTMRGADGTQEIQRQAGGQGGVPSSPVLQSGVFIPSAGDAYRRDVQQAREGAPQGFLRIVWHERAITATPPQRQSGRQPSLKPDDLVRILSREMALGEWEEIVERTVGLYRLWQAVRWVGAVPEAPDSLQEIWRSLTHQDKNWVAVCAGPGGFWDDPTLMRRAMADGSWELDLPRVVTHEPQRRQKLQAAGNAIVPQVAYEILKVMIGEAT